MKLNRTGLAAAAGLTLGLLGLVACTSMPDTPAPFTLVAAKTAVAPSLDAGAADPAWSNAKPMTVGLNGGMNFANGKGETTATLKAVYTADTLYMLIQYADPTDSKRRGPYQKQADGSWKKLVDPANKGGDDNIYYEDKWAMLWPIGTVANFEKKSCAVTCHLGEGKPYGNKYTRNAGEMLDTWHMKGSRSAVFGQVDDQYTDHTTYDPKASPNAGRKSDPGNPKGDYTNIALDNGKPKFMHRDGKPGNGGGTYYIKSGDEVAFDDSRFKTGDEVASYIALPLNDDRGNISVRQTWSNGTHTSVISRRLVTGSKFDVQFDNLAGRYLFGFAAFDNAQVQHSTADDTLTLVFGK